MLKYIAIAIIIFIFFLILSIYCCLVVSARLAKLEFCQYCGKYIKNNEIICPLCGNPKYSNIKK